MLLALAFFALNVQRLVRYMRIVGQPEDRTDHPFDAAAEPVSRSASRRRRSSAIRSPARCTRSIFWGFMVLTAGTVEILIQGVFRGFSYALILPPPLYSFYALSQDAFALLVLAAVGFAFYRRLVLHPKRLEGDKLEHTDALIILSMIGGLMVTLLLVNAFSFALRPGRDDRSEAGLARAVASVSADCPRARSTRGAASFWWMHALLILAS